MSESGTEILIILLLVLLNGIFSLSEMSVVSSRKVRLQQRANDGDAGAFNALKLAENPNIFLSTIQIGITLIGIVAGAFSGASLGGPVAERLQALGMGQELSVTFGFVLVIGLTTYASLVIGELVPKQIALRSAERIALAMAQPMELLARISAPLVWLLDNSSALIFRMMRMKRDQINHVTAEELQMVFAEATRSGVIEEHERAVMSGVVRLADRPIREVMTPRTEVDWLDIDATREDIHKLLIESQHSRFPVAEHSVDDIRGVVQSRDIVAAQLGGDILDLRKLMRPLEKVPDQLDALDALEILREAEVPMILVHDEYGHFEGIVTPNDLLSSIAGEFVSDQDEKTQRSLIERADGSFLVSGAMAIDALAERLGIRLSEDRDYATVAGHALSQLRHLPEEGESFEDQDWIFEIVDMDGRKIDKLIVRASNPEID